MTWDASCVECQKVKLLLRTGDHPLSTRIVHNYQALCTFLGSEQIGGKRLIISSSSAGPACENSVRMSPSLLAIGSAALSILPGTSHAPRAPSTLTRRGLLRSLELYDRLIECGLFGKGNIDGQGKDRSRSDKGRQHRIRASMVVTIDSDSTIRRLVERCSMRSRADRRIPPRISKGLRGGLQALS